jgi:hypothetical protein
MEDAPRYGKRVINEEKDRSASVRTIKESNRTKLAEIVVD